MFIEDEVEMLVAKYKGKKITKKLQKQLEVEITTLVNEWIADTCQGMLV